MDPWTRYKICCFQEAGPATVTCLEGGTYGLRLLNSRSTSGELLLWRNRGLRNNMAAIRMLCKGVLFSTSCLDWSVERKTTFSIYGGHRLTFSFPLKALKQFSQRCRQSFSYPGTVAVWDGKHFSKFRSSLLQPSSGKETAWPWTSSYCGWRH